MVPEACRCRRRDATELTLILAGKRGCARRQAAQVTTVGFRFTAHSTEPGRVTTQEPAGAGPVGAELTEVP
jgi:hypothetical protein